MVLALGKLAKGPIQKIAWLAGANRKIAGAHVEKMQGMMGAIGQAAPERTAWLNHDEAERLVQSREAGDRRGGAGESAADHAKSEWRLSHHSPRVWPLPDLSLRPNPSDEQSLGRGASLRG